MADQAVNRIEAVLNGSKRDNGEDDVIAALAKLNRAHGAESRAADVVTEKVMDGAFRFSPALGWLVWDGRRWDSDDTAEHRVLRAVREFVDVTERDYRAQVVTADTTAQALLGSILNRLHPDQEKDDKGKQHAEAALVDLYGTADEQQEYARLDNVRQQGKQQADIWMNLLNAGKLKSLITLCKVAEGVLTRATEFDRQPQLLTCENGTVNLATGELLPHDPAHLITKLAGGPYDPNAKSAAWEKAKNAIHPDVAQWFQTRIGQSATGYTPDDDAMVVSAGGGENGKTAVMNAILRAFGEYGDLISHRVLIAQPGQHPTELMDLRGLRFALLEETPEEGRLDTHQLKTTVGTPKIKARHMRMNAVTFTTSHTMWVNTNFLPQVDSTDHGTWRRLKAMPWPFKFLPAGKTPTSPNERAGDRTLKKALDHDPNVPAAVLAWIVEGAVRYLGELGGVAPEDPEAVVAAGRTWRAASDVGFQFVSERLIADSKSFITGSVLRAEFEEFLAAQGKRSWSAQTLNTRMPDSMLEAGIRCDRTPAVTTKIREGEQESRPCTDGWGGTGRPVDIGPGKMARVWRGVRFRTPADDRDQHLKAV